MIWVKSILAIDAFLIIFISIFEHKNIKKLLFWAIIISFFSILGFIAYILLGNSLKFNAKQMLINKQKTTKNYLSNTAWYKTYNKNLNLKINPIAKYIKHNYNTNLWHSNSINTFLDGKSFFNDLLNEINNAKSSINLEFYILSDDEYGQTLAKALLEKANAGVKIKVIYDAFGSKQTKDKFWSYLKESGIEIFSFFPNIFKLPFFNFKINHRNHRKIIIIDGKIGYIGGINIRKDHMGDDKKLKPWRDTQVKILGSAVYSLQNIFLNDYLYASNSNLTNSEISKFFPQQNSIGKYNLQILESGPEKEQSQIYNTYLKIINESKKYIFIESPYFVVDNIMVNSIIQAKKRNVDVYIILPKYPDHKLVYGAGLLCLKKLIENGVNVYLYSGFIHSKVLLTESVLSIGSCNFDNRSFKLNFECTCLCYDKELVYEHLCIIQNDILNSKRLTKKAYKKIKTKNIFNILLYKIIEKIL